MVEVTQVDRDAAAQFFGYKGYADAFSAWTQLGSTLDLEAACVALARHRQAGVQQGLDMAKTALEADAKLCDCDAFSEGECACGAWCEWKSITSARAVEIVSKLGANDGTDRAG